MRKQVEVAVIGGGILGVSLLYHLAKLGRTETILLEKNELTAGSTWHAAGLCTHFALNPTIQWLRAHSVSLYSGLLEEDTGVSVDFHPCGALRITRNPTRMDEFRQVKGLGQFTGYDFEIISPDDLKTLHPLAERGDGLLGGIYEPRDGYVDPSQAVQALAAGARSHGAEICRHTPVDQIQRTAHGKWQLRTPEDTVEAEILVNAAGTWCREIGTMMGVDLPVVPMLHQYLVTDRIPAVAELDKELPIIRDPEESWYVRQERDGLIVGPYEKQATPWAVDGVPPEFGMELLPPELDRVEHIVTAAMNRIPALADGGIKTIVNGPITFTPDANPLIGPAYGLPNAWLLTGSSMGVMEGGGAGCFLAQWIVEGEPPLDALAVDSRRFGGYADRDYRLAKAIECFGLQFGVHYPGEERPAARPAKVTPLYERQLAQGAQMGAVYGYERPNYFLPDPEAAFEVETFHRPGWHETVGAECRAVQNGVGVADLSPFSKFEIAGPATPEFLETLGANTPPRKTGQIRLLHVLYPSGGVASEFTVTKLAEDRFYLTSAAAARRHDHELLLDRSGNRQVEVRDCTDEWGVLGVMGPRSRNLLERVTSAKLDNAAFPWLTSQPLEVARVGIRALRVSYVGELGWELHVPMASLLDVYEALLNAGEPEGVSLFGAYAMNSMRLEKGYRAWGLDLTSERSPLEAGLSRFVVTENRDFIGRNGLLEREQQQPWRMALLAVDADSADAQGGQPVLMDGNVVGLTTSGAYGHRVGQSLALAYFRGSLPEEAAPLHVRILGNDHSARRLTQPLYDPLDLRLRDTA